MSTRNGWVVAQARVGVIRAPLRRPFRIATGRHDTLENVLLRVDLAGGATGWGEAAVAPHITGESFDQTRRNLQQAAEALVGSELGDYSAVCRSFAEYFPDNPAGLAALEMAVLDAVARQAGFPFWRFFGERPKRCVTDITIVLGTTREAGRQARRYHRLGFRSFKIKIGGDEARDVARILAVAAGAPGSAVLLDGNQAYDAEGALSLVRALRRRGLRPALLEQPVPRDDWDGLAKLTREAGVRICADESVRSLADVAVAVRRKAVTAINVKFAKSGILAAAEIAHFARAAGLRLMIGAMMESALSIAAAAQFAAGMGVFGFVDLDTTFFLRGPLARLPWLSVSGEFNVAGAGPGIGVANNSAWPTHEG